MTSSDVYEISSYSQWAGSMAIAITCLLHFKNRSRSIKVLGLYAIMSILLTLAQELTGLYFSNAMNNMIGNTFVLLEALLFSLIFFFATDSKLFQKLILPLSILYLVFYISAFLFFSKYSFSLIRTGRDFLMILYSITFFYYLLRKLPEENLLLFPMFWINSAVIFYFSGTFILSFFRDYIVNVLKDDTMGFWAFRNFFRFFFCLILAYAGWLNLKALKYFPKKI